MKETDEGVILNLEINPSSKRRKLEYDRWKDVIKVSVKSPPVKGKANRELLEFLKELFKRDVTILKGEKSTKKVVLIKDAKINDVLVVLKNFKATKSVK